MSFTGTKKNKKGDDTKPKVEKKPQPKAPQRPAHVMNEKERVDDETPKVNERTPAISPSPEQQAGNNEDDDRNLLSFRIAQNPPLTEVGEGETFRYQNPFPFRASNSQEKSIFTLRERLVHKCQRHIADTIEQCRTLGCDIPTITSLCDVFEDAIRQLEHLQVELRYANRRKDGTTRTNSTLTTTTAIPEPSHEYPTNNFYDEFEDDDGSEKHSSPTPPTPPYVSSTKETQENDEAGVLTSRTPPPQDVEVVIGSGPRPSPQQSKGIKQPPRKGVSGASTPQTSARGISKQLCFGMGVPSSTTPTKQTKKQSGVDERLRVAEERRQHASMERQAKYQVMEERQLNAKVRKEQTWDRIRAETQEKQGKAAQLHEQQITTITEKARTANVKAEEVTFIQKMKDQNKKTEFQANMEAREERKERRREELQQSSRERDELYRNVLDRKREIEERRRDAVERRQRERDEKMQALEERRKEELEQRQAKAEEAKRKVTEAQQHLQEEQEQKAGRWELRNETAAEQREAMREAQRKKRDEKRQKIQEARERKEAAEQASQPLPQQQNQKKKKTSATPPAAPTRSLHEALLLEESGAVSATLTPTTTSSTPNTGVSQKQYQRAYTWLETKGKAFVRSYVVENGKTQLRVLVQKFQSTANGNKGKTSKILHELLQKINSSSSASANCTAGDHALFRDVNIFGTIAAILVEPPDTPTFRLAATLLYVIVKDDTRSADYFVRCGALLQCTQLIVTLLHDPGVDFEDVSNLFNVVQLGITSLMSSIGSPRVKSKREVTHENMDEGDDDDYSGRWAIVFEVGGMTRLCTALTRYTPIPLSPTAAEAVYNALCITASTLNPTTTPTQTVEAVTSEVLSLLSNVLLHPKQEDLSRVLMEEDSRVVCVCYVAFRVLNTALLHSRTYNSIAKSTVMRSMMLHEMLHVLHGFLEWITQHRSAESLLDKDPVGALFLNSLQQLKAQEQDQQPLFLVPPRTHEIKSLPCLRSLLHEVLLFIGQMAVMNRAAQEAFLWGETPIIRLLANLPVAYFTEPLHHTLFPVLIALTYNPDHDVTALSVLGTEMSLTSIVRYLQSNQHPTTKENDGLAAVGKVIIQSIIQNLLSSGHNDSSTQKLTSFSAASTWWWEDALKFYQVS